MQADASLLLAVNGLHNAFFDGFMQLCSDKWVWVPFYASILYVLLRRYPPRTAVTALLFIVLTIVMCDQLTAHVLRPQFARLRPSNLDNPLSQWVHVVDGYRGGPYSFPSSHAANTAGLAFFCACWFRQRWLSWLLAVWTLLVCYSRMYLGVHYPGDLLVGILVGMLCAWVAYWCLRRLCRWERLGLEPEPTGRSVQVVHDVVPTVMLLLTLAAFAVLSAGKL